MHSLRCGFPARPCTSLAPSTLGERLRACVRLHPITASMSASVNVWPNTPPPASQGPHPRRWRRDRGLRLRRPAPVCTARARARLSRRPGGGPAAGRRWSDCAGPLDARGCDSSDPRQWRGLVAIVMPARAGPSSRIRHCDRRQL